MDGGFVLVVLLVAGLVWVVVRAFVRWFEVREKLRVWGPGHHHVARRHEKHRPPVA